MENMTKYVKVCDCPPTGEYNSFVAGKFRQVETHGENCIHCGYVAMNMKLSDLQNKRHDATDKVDEIQDQTLELDQETINSLEGGEDVHFNEFSEGVY